jgi:RND family efflux transporter MFP subunit
MRPSGKAMEPDLMQKFERSPHLRMIVATAALAALIATGCKKTPPAAAIPIPQVAVTTVVQQDVPEYSDWVGTTEGFVNANIYPQISGYIVRQNYRDGDAVRTGAILFEIDPREYQAALDQANANLAQAQAQTKQNQLNLNRYTSLYKQGVVSEQEFDNQTQTTRATDAQVKAAQAAVETAKLNLGWTKVISPIDGIASIATAQVGDLVSPTSLLTTVSQLDPIKVEFPISEQQYLSVAQQINEDPNKRAANGPRFQMILSDGTVYKYLGKVYDVNRQVDIQTGTIKVEATFSNPDNILRPGLYAKIRASTGIIHNALLVPQSAILQTQGQSQVAVVSADDKVAMRTVDLGQQFGGFQVIKKGVAAGEQVVIEGLQKVHDGSEVTPHLVASAPSAASTPQGSAPQT